MCLTHVLRSVRIIWQSSLPVKALGEREQLLDLATDLILHVIT